MWRHKTKKTQTKLNWFNLLILIAVFLGIAFIYDQVQQLTKPTLNFSKASGAAVDISWGASPDQVEIGQTLNLPIQINTNSYAISGLQLVGYSNADQTTIDIISPANFINVINQLQNQQFTLVFFSSINQNSLFSTQNTSQTLAKLNLKFNHTGSYKISLNANKSQVTSFLFPNLSIQTPADKTITVVASSSTSDNKKSCNQNCATDTECQSQFICYEGRCRLPADKLDANCTTQPDLGIHRGCNEYCADGNECQSQFICYYNRCRLPKYPEIESCINPSPKPKTLTQTTGGSKTTTKNPQPSPSPSPSTLLVTILDIDNQNQSPTPSPSPSPTFKLSPSPTIKPSPSANLIQESKTQKSGLNLAKIGAIVIITGLIGGIIYAVSWIMKK